MRFLLVLLVLGTVASAAHAGLADDINALRARGCTGHAGATNRLVASRELDAVAREWSRGGRLRDALARASYRAVSSASMHIEGASTRPALLGAIASNYCETVTDPAFTAIGLSQSGRDTYIVLALPLTLPAVSDARQIAERVLLLVNEARSQPRNCGSTRFDAAPPLEYSAMLTRAALTQAQDMAQHDFFEHEGSDGSTVGVRASRAGYAWRTIGENIAAGSTGADAVVSGWLNSPGHCANIMAPSFSEMGVAFATAPKSKAFIYWSQVFGTPMPQKK